MLNKIKQHTATGRKVQISRSRPSNPSLNGYLLAASDELVLMHVFDDFEPDGYTVFRICDVESLRSGPHERHWDRMLAGEGLLGGLELQHTIDLSSMQGAISSIQQHFGRLIIECEDADEDIEDFYIGCVVNISDSVVVFDHFDGLGEWEEEPAEIDLDEITLLQFQTPYIQRFWKYANGPAPHSK